MSQVVYVDAPYPDYPADPWTTLAVFEGPDALQKAKDYVLQNYGGDGQGNINLLTIEETPDDV